MRKLKLQVQMTVDGFIAGPNGEMDCMIFNWDDELNYYVKELTEPVDSIVLGRKLADGFIPYWANVAATPVTRRKLQGRFSPIHLKLYLPKRLPKRRPGTTLHWQKAI